MPLLSLLVMVLLADMPIASAAPGGAGQDAVLPGAGGDVAFGTTTRSSQLNFVPARPRWAGRRAKRGSGGGAAASRALPPRRPLSASLPGLADEIDPGPAP